MNYIVFAWRRGRTVFLSAAGSPRKGRLSETRAMVITMKSTRITTILLAALMAAGSVTFASCGGDTPAADAQTNAPSTDTGSAEVTTAEPDPFEGFDYGGEEIRILVSANDYDGRGSSIYAIKHEEEENGDIVKDNVYKRNKNVEELLNVSFVFTENEEDYVLACEDLWNENDLVSLIIPKDKIRLTLKDTEGTKK